MAKTDSNPSKQSASPVNFYKTNSRLKDLIHRNISDNIHFFNAVIHISFKPALHPSSHSFIRSQTHKLIVWAYLNKSIGNLRLPPNSKTL